MKKAILMMTFGSPEEISFEGVAEFFTNIRRVLDPKTTRFRLSMTTMSLSVGRPCSGLHVRRLI